VSKPAAYAGAPSPSSATVLKPATITDIRRAVFPDVVRVTIALDNEVPFHEERIDGPSRIFIDFPSTRATAPLTDQTLRFDDSEIVRQVRIGRHPNVTTRVVLDATGVTSYSVYPIYNPYRLVIDCLRPTAPAPRAAQVTATAAVATLPPRAVRPKPEIVNARVAKPEAIDRIPDTPKRLASRRLISTWARALPYSTPLSTAALNRAYVPPLFVRRFDVDWGRQLPLAAPTSAALIAQALAQEAATVVASVLPSAPLLSASPTLSASSASPLSMARQLGLGVSRIVIDPGHGGHDSGAKGKGGVSEAELVLDVSLRLQKLLEKVQGVEVILTRQTDCFVSLPERTAIANREGADLFLSVHANASANDQAHGVETYFLDFANNLGAAAVAARENAASGQAMGALPDFVKAIALNNKLDESRDFAALVQQSMVDRLRLTNKTVKNLGVKQAPFVVLIGASMPSVLAEISFVTNPQEAKLLKSNAYRQSVAEALFAAVRKYQTSLTPTRTVASQ
jgi:N-acetylmuramoyl-L-alanine amidase